MEGEDKNLNKILNLLQFTICLNGGGTHTRNLYLGNYQMILTLMI
jgi:hypothetical protein